MDAKTVESLNAEVKAYFRPGPGRQSYRYIKGEDVISRLNHAFAHEWSSKVVEVYEKGSQVIVLVELEACGVWHQGFGGAEIAVHKDGPRKGQPVDLSNTYKSAFTNALKKAAEQFGVGLMSDDEPEIPEQYERPEPQYKQTSNESPQQAPVSSKPAPVASGPVHGQAVLTQSSPSSTQDEVKALLGSVSIEDLRKGLEAVVNSGTQQKPQTSEVRNTQPQYDPAKSRMKEVSSPFQPSGDGERLINDIQLNALMGLAKMKKISDPAEAIKLALPEGAKTEYKQLTHNEARQLIKVLNAKSE